MRTGQVLYAAVMKDSGEIFSHPEGEIMSESKAGLDFFGNSIEIIDNQLPNR
jgi:hypothetical protein